MEGNTFHTTMAKHSSAITQPVGLSARGRMACMATGYSVCVWEVAMLPTPASTSDGGFLEKFWLQGCKFWGIYLAVMGI